MNKQKSSLIRDFGKSILDFNEYIFFFNKSMGRAFAYLFFLTILLGGLSIIRPLYDFNTVYNKFLYDYNSTLPNFTYKNGILNVDSKTPINLGDDQTAYIVDTTGNTSSKVLNNYQAGALITKDKIYEKGILGGVTEADIKNIIPVDLDKSSVKESLPTLKVVLIFIIFLAKPISFFVVKLVSALFIAFLASILNHAINIKANFSSLFKLSIYALTLPSVFKLVVDSINVSSSFIDNFFSLIYYGVALLYISKALQVIKINENVKI